MNSFLLIGLLGLAVFIFLLIFFRRNKFILVLLFLAAGTGAWIGYKAYTRTNKSLSFVKPDIQLSASGLVEEYEKNDSVANKKYLGKILEVTGLVKEVTNDEGGFPTVVLGEAGKLSSVRCSMDSSQRQDASRLVAGTSITIRGACTGFNKDEMGLGSDVILNRSVIVEKK